MGPAIDLLCGFKTPLTTTRKRNRTLEHKKKKHIAVRKYPRHFLGTVARMCLSFLALVVLCGRWRTSFHGTALPARASPAAAIFFYSAAPLPTQLVTDSNRSDASPPPPRLSGRPQRPRRLIGTLEIEGSLVFSRKRPGGHGFPDMARGARREQGGGSGGDVPARGSLGKSTPSYFDNICGHHT